MCDTCHHLWVYRPTTNDFLCETCGKITTDDAEADMQDCTKGCPYAANSVDNQSFGCYGPYYHVGCMLYQDKENGK